MAFALGSHVYVPVAKRRFDVFEGDQHCVAGILEVLFSFGADGRGGYGRKVAESTHSREAKYSAS